MGGSYISGLQKIAQIINVLQEGAPSEDSPEDSPSGKI